MFDQHIIDVLKRSERRSIPFLGEPEMSRYPIRPLGAKLHGGVRYRQHPLPQMDFQPDTLSTGDEIYMPSPRRLVGGKGKRVYEQSLQDGIDLRGGSLKSFGRSLLKGLKTVGKAVAPVVMPVVKDFATKQGRKLLEKGLEKGMEYVLPAAEEAAPLMLAAGRRRRAPSDKMKRRAELVRKVMHQHGCSLPEASKYIKDHGLKY